MNALVGLPLGRVRRVRVNHWQGAAPVVGDRLRSLKGRYLIVGIGEWPTALHLVTARGLTFEGGVDHPWSWRRGGRRRRGAEVRAL